MDGPDILVRSLSQRHVPDKFGNLWQYHSRSDHHSKIACWSILFDLLQHSSVLAAHVTQGKVVFGINQEMRDFASNRTKDLDLVIALPSSEPATKRSATMDDLALRWGVRLSNAQRATLAALPSLRQGPAGQVLVALEAKACMTAHVKALPRLFDELTSSHQTVHAHSENALAAGYVMVNAAPTFASSDLNKYDLSQQHPTTSTHPDDVVTKTIDKIIQIPRRTTTRGVGFDALGISVVSLRNDGSPVTLLNAPPAPTTRDVYHYDQMIGRLAQGYNAAFAGI